MKIRNSVRLIVVALFFAVVTSIHAFPQTEIIKTYWDGCGDNLTFNGQSFWLCGGGWGSTGTLGGRWLEIDSTDCDTQEVSVTYWEKCPNTSQYVQRDELGDCQCG